MVLCDAIEQALNAAERRGYDSAVAALRDAAMRLPGEFKSVQADRLLEGANYLERRKGHREP